MPKPLDRRIRNREHDAKRRAEQPWRKWYGTSRWRAIRAAQLLKQPLCERCQARGMVTAATVCHHIDDDKSTMEKFFAGPFASSCADCHDTDEQRVERGGRARQQVDSDGWPVE